MPRPLVVLIPLFVLVFVALACTGASGPTASPTAGETATREPEPSPTATGGSPTAEATPTSAATTVTAVEDLAAFLKQFHQPFVRQRCLFNAAAGQLDCGENGVFQPHPPLEGESVHCDLLFTNDQPFALHCSTDLSVTYYAIAP